MRRRLQPTYEELKRSGKVEVGEDLQSLQPTYEELKRVFGLIALHAVYGSPAYL